MKHFLRRPDILLAILGILVGIAFGIVTVFDWLHVDPHDLSPYFKYLTPTLAAVLIFCAVAWTVRLWRLLARIREVFRTTHWISHHLRDALHISIQKNHPPPNAQSMTTEFRRDMSDEQTIL